MEGVLLFRLILSKGLMFVVSYFVLHFYDEAAMREKPREQRRRGRYITFICQQCELHAGSFTNDHKGILNLDWKLPEKARNTTPNTVPVFGAVRSFDYPRRIVRSLLPKWPISCSYSLFFIKSVRLHSVKSCLFYWQ